MKNLLKIFICCLAIMLFASCSITSPAQTNEVNPETTITPKDNIGVYSFSGENEFIKISNGKIIITEESEEFIGGDLDFKGEKSSNLFLYSDYSEKYYVYMDDGDEHSITGSVYSDIRAGSGDALYRNGNSNVTSETLFSPEVWDKVKDSLNFTVNGTLQNGESFEYSIVLDVVKQP